MINFGSPHLYEEGQLVRSTNKNYSLVHVTFE
jgi:hypothetical protein